MAIYVPTWTTNQWPTSTATRIKPVMTRTLFETSTWEEICLALRGKTQHHSKGQQTTNNVSTHRNLTWYVVYTNPLKKRANACMTKMI
ncbi:MAG: hypothetical protein CL920_23590 [Deltaproteobacteria bacterium]|nr:hypothetical protein [Deltaproteobacteria bacterium]MBU51685.1 hypothetical protein [Deltaproteobacteria bacterium]